MSALDEFVESYDGNRMALMRGFELKRSSATKNIVVGRRIYMKWTSEEIEFVRDHYYTMPMRSIAKSLGRTHQSVNNLITKMKLNGLPSKRQYPKAVKVTSALV